MAQMCCEELLDTDLSVAEYLKLWTNRTRVEPISSEDGMFGDGTEGQTAQ